jgi:hypothetical protein
MKQTASRHLHPSLLISPRFVTPFVKGSQERRGGCRRNLRNRHAPNNAFCAGQIDPTPDRQSLHRIFCTRTAVLVDSMPLAESHESGNALPYRKPA